MCDAAVVLEGKTGTESDLTSAVLLRRPVALVGPSWQDTCQHLREASDDKLSELREAMIDKFGEEPDEALGYDPEELRKVCVPR
jgi:hypothetical protein